MKLLLVTLYLALITTQAFASDLPNPQFTPGATDPYITQQNIHQTVCIKGYTKTIRPPAHWTNKLKKRQIREYGYEDRNPKHYEEDSRLCVTRSMFFFSVVRSGGADTWNGNLSAKTIFCQ